MVQEFHVLRCFACETFQVQQVKKAKKWNCKMCGEKQSVIKEYGRGSGADCRRHVQKLNSLRGQLLEEENENAWARWEEDEECEYNQEDPALPSEPYQDDGESRWNKYIETTGIPDVEEEEEENIYTESKRFSSPRNIRKRKRGRGARRGFGSRHDNKEDDDDHEEEDQNVGTHAWRRNRGPVKPLTHSKPVNPSATLEDHTFPTPPFCSNTPKPAFASKPLPSAVPSRNVPGNQYRPSQSTQRDDSQATGLLTTDRSLADVAINSEAGKSARQSVTKVNQPETKSSKWSRFLISPSNEVQEDDEQEDPHWSETGKGLGVGNTNSDSATGFENLNHFKPKPQKISHSSGLIGSLPGLASRCGVVDKIKSATACFGFVSATNQMTSPTFTTQTTGKERPVCHQPPPAKRPCPGLAVSSLFQTDEDFDDTF